MSSDAECQFQQIFIYSVIQQIFIECQPRAGHGSELVHVTGKRSKWRRCGVDRAEQQGPSSRTSPEPGSGPGHSPGSPRFPGAPLGKLRDLLVSPVVRGSRAEGTQGVAIVLAITPVPKTATARTSACRVIPSRLPLGWRRTPLKKNEANASRFYFSGIFAFLGLGAEVHFYFPGECTGGQVSPLFRRIVKGALVYLSQLYGTSQGAPSRRHCTHPV